VVRSSAVGLASTLHWVIMRLTDSLALCRSSLITPFGSVAFINGRTTRPPRSSIKRCRQGEQKLGFGCCMFRRLHLMQRRSSMSKSSLIDSSIYVRYPVASQIIYKYCGRKVSQCDRTDTTVTYSEL